MQVQVMVIEPHDGHQPGERYDTSERSARQLEAKGLVKVGFANKSLDPVTENKQPKRPSPAAGEAAVSSASQAAQASPRTTAAPSKRGGTRNQRRGRSSR